MPIDSLQIKSTNYMMLLLMGILFCQKNVAQQTSADIKDAKMVFKGVSLIHNGTYPKLYTCDSTGISPALEWSNAPTNTKSFAITMHHFPRTGEKHVYWVVYNIPSNITSVPENLPGIYSFGKNTVNGRNSYTPPCSKGPGTKVYTLTLYALSEAPTIPLSPNQITMDALLKSIETIKLDSVIMNVLYARKAIQPEQKGKR